MLQGVCFYFNLLQSIFYWLATVSRAGAGHGVQNGVAERYGDVSYAADIKLITTINPRKVLTTRKKRTTYLRIGKTEAMITRRDRF